MAKKKQKFYAIRSVEGMAKGLIVGDWATCEGLVKGKSAVYKSFNTIEEAREYIGQYEEEDKEEDILNSDKDIFYVDGSYMNDRIGWGFIYVKNYSEVDYKCGGLEPTKETSRNITGELIAAQMAVNYGISKGMKEIYIVNDYQGISSFANGSWKPKKKDSRDYTQFMQSVKDKIKVKYIKVHGHTGNEFNDRADEVAKEGTLK